MAKKMGFVKRVDETLYGNVRRVSVSNAKGPPVPIPNTEVKLCSAENTCLETDRKNRS